jgi:hypothetical protein
MKILKITLFCLLTMSAFMLTGCRKDPCETADCVNGVCSEDPDDRKAAICTCSPGYETENCSKGINAKLSGEYTYDENCTLNGQRNDLLAEITPKAGTTNEFIIGGLWDQGFNRQVTAVMGTNGTTFTIARQPNGAGYEIESSNGTLTSDGKTLTLTYTATFPPSGFTEICTAVLTRN